RATVENWPSWCSSLLADGPLWAAPATLLVSSRLVGAFPSRVDLPDAVGGPLLGVKPLDGGAGPLAVGPLDGVVGLRAEGPLGVGDVVGVPVVLALGGGLAPGPPAPSRRRRRPQRLQ